LANFSERDIQAIRLSAEGMARVANESLAIANTSRNLATRASRLNVVRVNVERLKGLSVEYPFLSLTSLEAFGDSVRKVEQETAAMAASVTSELQSDEPKYGTNADPFQRLSLWEQCEFLDVQLEVIHLPRRNREWIFDDITFKKPEAAALAYFQNQGYRGTLCEGSALLMIMKCASLNYLEKVNTFKNRADACMRAFEAQCWIHSHLAHYVIEEIEASTEHMVRAHFREIASQPNYRAVYPAMDEEALAAIWRAMSSSRLAQLAGFIFQNPDYRAGWPDLTLARGDELRFVEIKTTDKLHSSQRAVFSEVLKPWGATVTVMKIKPLGR
jgi:hypothetical protein